MSTYHIRFAAGGEFFTRNHDDYDSALREATELACAGHKAWLYHHSNHGDPRGEFFVEWEQVAEFDPGGKRVR